MPAIDPDSISALRDALLRLEPLFALRRFEASEEDYENLAHADLRCEFLDGVLIVHSGAPLRHEARVGFLMALLGGFTAKSGNVRAYASNAVMQLGGPKAPRLCADVSLLKSQNASRIRGERVVGPMDLVVEVISESTRDYDLGEIRLRA